MYQTDALVRKSVRHLHQFHYAEDDAGQKRRKKND